MKYKTVSLHQSSNGTWEVSLQFDDKDRVNKKTYPNSMGFFHYPENMKDDVALNILLDKLISDREESIEILKKSIDGLNKLKVN